jgi:hypothetical protein
MHLGWQAKQRPDAIAVIESGGRTVTYAELDARSRQLAAALDLKPGDAIAIRMPSGAAFLEVARAAQRSGHLYTPVNTHLLPAEVEEMAQGELLIIEEVYERLLAAPGRRESEECEGRELIGDAPVKFLLDDANLPTPGELAASVAAVRPRPVAVHCVTRVQLLVTLLALEEGPGRSRATGSSTGR